jgi:hypothetical protein
MSLFYFYPYYSRDLRLFASAFLVCEIKKRVKTKTIAGVHRYLLSHQYAKRWAGFDKKTQFLYLKNSTSPIRAEGKIERYEKVFPGVSKLLDHPFFKLLDTADIVGWAQYKERLVSFVDELPYKESNILKLAITHLEENTYCFDIEKKIIDELNEECSIHTIATLLILYLYYQTMFLSLNVYRRLEKEIFSQFVQLIYFDLDGKCLWIVYKIIQLHFFSLENSHFETKPYVWIRNREKSPQAYEPMFFNHFNNEQELVTHIKEHFEC